MMMRLSDKVAVITDGGRGIGRAIALRFAQEGAKVVVHHAHHADNEGQRVVDEVRALGRDVIAVAADVRSEEQVHHLVEAAIAAFGRIDIWVNSAEAHIFTDALSDEEKLQMALDVDVRGTFVCCRMVLPVMQAQGSGCIINMSWDEALVEGMPGIEASIYAAAKGAVHSLSLCLAREFAPAIRVNVLAPGEMDTEVTARLPEQMIATVRTDTPMGRRVEPADVAEAAVYLASNEARFITGQTILVNGGRVMY
jgi:3-oxoacyl-[acyl-carrier protein] reductase